MNNFFDLVQSFFQMILDGYDIVCAYVVEFTNIISSAVDLIVSLISPFPYLISVMVLVVFIIAVIKLILSLVGVII